jgi:hypothetical protein
MTTKKEYAYNRGQLEQDIEAIIGNAYPGFISGRPNSAGQ